jgi:proteasome lid subunit RPN8/RPN11
MISLKKWIKNLTSRAPNRKPEVPLRYAQSPGQASAASPPSTTPVQGSAEPVTPAMGQSEGSLDIAPPGEVLAGVNSNVTSQTDTPVEQLESSAESVAPPAPAEAESPELSATAEAQTKPQPVPEPEADTVATQATDEEPSTSEHPEHTTDVQPHDETQAVESNEQPEIVIIEIAHEAEQQSEAHPRIRVLAEAGPDADETTEMQAEPQRPRLLPGSLLSHSASLFRCKGEDRRPGDCDILMLQSVYVEINKHLSEDKSREYGGLLLGVEMQSADSDYNTIVITHSLRAHHTDGTIARLTFSHETWAEFGRHTDELKRLGAKLQRLGWYHSHPSHGVFLSNYDLNVCEDFTRQSQVALVVDPIQNHGGFFVHGRTYYRPHSPQGFWELQDLRPESIVTWRNVRRLSAPAEQEDHIVKQGNAAFANSSTEFEFPASFAEPQETSHAQVNEENDNWTAGGTGVGDVVHRRISYIPEDEDHHVIRVQNMHVRDRRDMPPWAMLLVAALVPTAVAVLALITLNDLSQKIQGIEESINTLKFDQSRIEKPREVARPLEVQPSPSPSESDQTANGDTSPAETATPEPRKADNNTIKRGSVAATATPRKGNQQQQQQQNKQSKEQKPQQSDQQPNNAQPAKAQATEAAPKTNPATPKATPN